jgi:hypothetical protein
MKQILVLISVLALTACGESEQDWIEPTPSEKPVLRQIKVEHVVTQDGLECVKLLVFGNPKTLSCNWADWNWKRNNGKLKQQAHNGT